MTYRLRNIGIAVALAVVAALLTTFYVTNYKRTVRHGEQKVPVYVASHDIALGTSGTDVAHRNLLRVEQVPRRSVVPGAISQPDQLDLKAPESTKFSSKLGSNPNQPFSAMIAVTDSQAQKLFYVMENGKWTLELRPVTDAADSPESVDTAATVLGDGLRVNERKL